MTAQLLQVVPLTVNDKVRHPLNAYRMILCLRYHPLKMSQKMLLGPKGNLSVKLQLW